MMEIETENAEAFYARLTETYESVSRVKPFNDDVSSAFHVWKLYLRSKYHCQMPTPDDHFTLEGRIRVDELRRLHELVTREIERDGIRDPVRYPVHWSGWHVRYETDGPAAFLAYSTAREA